MTALLDRIRIVLIQPAGARNVGAIVRVMKNMGLSQLWIVQPQCDVLSDEARHMAVHAADLLKSATICDSLADALSGCCLAVATIGRDCDRSIRSPRDGLNTLLETVGSSLKGLQGAVVFGREDHGLSNAEIDQCQLFVSIPTAAAYQSLNLAQAVGVLAYELQLLAGKSTKSQSLTPQKPEDPLADLAQVEGYFQDLEALLLEVDFLQAHTAASRMAKLRDLLRRGEASAGDVAMLRGMIRQVRWAIGQRNSRKL